MEKEYGPALRSASYAAWGGPARPVSGDEAERDEPLDKTAYARVPDGVITVDLGLTDESHNVAAVRPKASSLSIFREDKWVSFGD